MSQRYPSLIATDATSAVEDVVVQSPHCSSSPATSQSDVDVDSPQLSPDGNADYSVAAENVSAASDSYQRCQSRVKPFTAVHFDTPPADIGLYGEDNEHRSKNRSVTGLQNSGSLVESNKNGDKIVSGLSSLPCKNDADCSTAGQDLSQNLSHMSSHVPHPSVTCAAVTMSSDNSDGKHAADLSNYSSQFGSLDLTGRYSESAESELSGSDFCSAVSQPALDSASSDQDYARVSLTERRFAAELCGAAAPLSPEYDV